MTWFKSIVLPFLFSLASVAVLSAHVVEQFYAEHDLDRGVIIVNFDVAYAMPEVRDLEFAPQPSREWLVAQSDERHAILRKEADIYLREYIQFESDGEVIDFAIKFPDFAASPYEFPKLLNGGAYYNVELIPFSKVGSLRIRVKEGEFPKLVIAHKVMEELRFQSLEPSEMLELEIAPIESRGQANVEVSLSTWQLLVLGFRHVIPDGLDHVLFIIGMCLMASTVKQLLWQSLVFTLSHTLSMGLVVSQIFPVYSYSVSGYIEAIIAISITFIAVESLFMKTDLRWRCLLIALFGFVHGLGFAGSLGSTLQFLSADHWLIPLVLANVGIEIAQALLVIGCFSLLLYLRQARSEKEFNYVRITTALVIASFGVVWFFNRLF